MYQAFRSLAFALAFMGAGFTIGQAGLLDLPALAQLTAPPPADAGATGSRDRLPGGAAAEMKAAAKDAAANVAPEVKAVLEQVGKKVDTLERTFTGLATEARAKAVHYAIWAAVGLIVLTFVSSVLGGLVVAMMFRRR